MENVKIYEKPMFRSSQMIIGMDGWVNAGKVSTFSVKYLVNKLEAKKFGEILQGEFHNYSIQRPHVSIREGLIQSYIPPQSIFYYWRGREENLNLILLLGVEPYVNWPKYVDALLRVAEEMNVKRIYTIGGYLENVTPDEETLISSTTNNEKLLDKLKKVGSVLTQYSGPTSIYSEIMWRCRTKGVDVISLWSAVPAYIDGIYPKAAYYILKKITVLTGLNIDLADLKRKAESFKMVLERRAVKQSELRRLLKNLGKRERKPTYIL